MWNDMTSEGLVHKRLLFVSYATCETQFDKNEKKKHRLLLHKKLHAWHRKNGDTRKVVGKTIK